MTDPAPRDAVEMECSNDKCAAERRLHKACYDAFEAVLIRTIQSSMGRTRDWTDDQCRRAMWGRVYDLIFRNCRCVCGGHLKRLETVAVAAAAPADVAAAGNAAEEGKKRKNKAGRKDLPKLVVDKTKAVGASHCGGDGRRKSLEPCKTRPGDDRFHQAADDRWSTSGAEHYIPGLMSTSAPAAKPQRKHADDVRLGGGESKLSAEVDEASRDEPSRISYHSRFDCRDAFAYWRHEYVGRALIDLFGWADGAEGNGRAVDDCRLLRALMAADER